MIRAALALVALLTVAPAFAADPAAPPVSTTVNLRGLVSQPQILTMADLRKLPAVTITVTQETGKGPFTASFTGAALWPLLDSAGIIAGAEKNGIIRRTIFVTGTDDYQAALSEGELDPKLEGKQVILATDRDGKPLDSIQLVIPGDAHATRSVHSITTIEVR